MWPQPPYDVQQPSLDVQHPSLDVQHPSLDVQLAEAVRRGEDAEVRALVL
jgi:hypothetical protein